jgi:hypothetical protein
VIGSIFRFSALWLVLATFYALFAGEVSMTEVVAGLIATGIAVSYSVLLHRSRSRALALWAPWPRVVARPIAALAPDAWRVGRVLLRVLWRRPDGSAGMPDRQPFREGEHDPQDAGRRGVATLGLSLAPNGYVLGIEAGAIVLHRLVSAAPSADREWPA